MEACAVGLMVTKAAALIEWGTGKNILVKKKYNLLNILLKSNFALISGVKKPE